MELKPGYKQTEVGVIPEDWDAVPLGKLYKFSNGVNADKAAYGKGLRFINVLEPITYSHIRGPEITGLVELTSQVASAYTVNHGDIVFNRTSETDTELGMAAAYLGHEKVVFGGFVIRGQAISDDLDPTYAGYALRGEMVRDQIIPLGQGAVRANIGQESLRKVRVLVPPEHEQKLIAEALQDIDSLPTNIQESLYKKRQIKQAAMQELLTGKRRLPGFEGEWEVKTLKDIVKMPVTDGPHMTPRFLETGVPFLSVNNLVDNRVNFSDLRFISEEDHRTFSRKCKPQKGDILLGKAASVGKVAIVDNDTEFNIWSPIALIRVTENNSPQYVYYALQGQDLVDQISLLTNASSQGNIGMGDIEKLAFRLPGKEEQTAIASTLADLDAELSALEASKDKAQQLKQGMMQQLLTGEIRLT